MNQPNRVFEKKILSNERLNPLVKQVNRSSWKERN